MHGRAFHGLRHDREHERVLQARVHRARQPEEQAFGLRQRRGDHRRGIGVGPPEAAAEHGLHGGQLDLFEHPARIFHGSRTAQHRSVRHGGAARRIHPAVSADVGPEVRRMRERRGLGAVREELRHHAVPHQCVKGRAPLACHGPQALHHLERPLGEYRSEPAVAVRIHAREDVLVGLREPPADARDARSDDADAGGNVRHRIDLGASHVVHDDRHARGDRDEPEEHAAGKARDDMPALGAGRADEQRADDHREHQARAQREELRARAHSGQGFEQVAHDLPVPIGVKRIAVHGLPPAAISP